MRSALYLIPIGLLISCGQSSVRFSEEASSTEAAETNGYPSVVRVIVPDGSGLCTGTFISPRAVLTASHCTTQIGTYRILADWGATFTTREVVKLGNGSVSDKSDLALLLFDSNKADPKANQVTPISSNVAVGDKVTLVGYGCNNVNTMAGIDIKRSGRNQVYQKGDYIQLATPLKAHTAQKILGPDNLSGTCFGDSGGPLLKANTQGNWVVGVTHAGSWNTQVLFSLYTDISRSENWTFLENTENSYGLYLTHPCAEPGTQLSQCQTSQALTGIVGFLHMIFAKMLFWLGL
ncbi:MAG: trypsin-like serine protease [Deltaproteobacteria bacterium]|nr:trypsin-like serine protease [Deltaproteobacteria bacterium]MBI3293660.1 trypsin-like serine protease [Deltaproteobacteria bacterium]